MGKADAAVRNWLSDKRRFADLFNGVIFSGREVVTADELEEQKGETSVLIPDKAGGTRPVQNLHEVMGMLKYRGDKEGLQKYIKENSSYFSNLDKDSYFAVGSFLKSKRLMKKVETAMHGKERNLNMCKAIEDLYEDGIEKGIVQGKRDTALNLKKMGMAAEQIAQAVGETAAIVREWLSEANAAK